MSKETSKIRYEWLKAHHICVTCGHEDAYKNHVQCLECHMNANERGKKYRAKNLDVQKAREHKCKNKERIRRKAAGLCPQCGKRKPADGRAWCEYCLAKARRKYERKCREKGLLSPSVKIELGLCAVCANPAIPGKKICQSCYDKSCKNLEKARASRKTDYFRQQNQAFWSEKQANSKKKGVK